MPQLTDHAARGSHRIRITRDDSATRLLDTATTETAIRAHVNVAN
ncbi:hypothetical protein ACFZC5_10325 [Nocardia gamkensis]